MENDHSAGLTLMADLADVEDTLVGLIVSALYPEGIDADSILGVPCRVYRGWPGPSALNVDLLAGTVNVTVAPDTDAGRTTTRYSLSWQDDPIPPTLSAVVEDLTVTFSGLVTADQATGLLVDGQTYVYPAREGDTPNVVAASIAAMVRSSRPAHLNGSTITIPGATKLIARVVRSGTGFTEVRRQERDLRVISWCPTPATRDTVVAAIDQALVRYAFLDLEDRTRARVLYKGTSVYDQAQNALLYRRDLIYTVEYPTTIMETLPAMLFGQLSLNTAEFTA
jgi:hypothetical protein